MQKFLIFALMSCTFLYGDLKEYLKSPHDKSVMQTIRNIDFIYMINLDQRAEKWEKSIEQLAPYGIIPCRLSAVNGWELSLDAINDVGLVFSFEMQGGMQGTCYHLDEEFQPSHESIQVYGRTYFCHCMSRGAIGIALSHLSILQDAFDSGYETIWVMEDDIEIKKDPHILSELIEKLDDVVGKSNWDILFTDRDIRNGKGEYVPNYWAGRRPDFIAFSQVNDYAMRKPISADFVQVGSRSGAHSMILRRSGIKKLLQFFQAHQIFFPYDMEYILPPGIKLYTVQEDVVSNLPQASSDNGGPNYLKNEK